jgi:glycosyltransferase involved in cell wall biosynthesis
MKALTLLLHDERFSGWTVIDKLTRYHFSIKYLEILRELGFAPQLYTFHQVLKRKESYRLQFGEVKIFPVKFRFPPLQNFGNDHNPSDIFKEMLHDNPDLVHFHNYYLFSFPYTAHFVKRKMKKLLTTQLHGYYTDPFRKTLYFSCLASLKKADCIFYSYSPEKIVYNYLGVSSKAVKVPMPGVDPSIFKPMKRKSETDLLYVGRIPIPTAKKGEKKPHVLIFIMRELIKRGKNLKLKIVGDGPGLNFLKSLTINLKLEKNVAFEGYVPHAKLPAFYQNSALTLVPMELYDVDGWFDGSIQESLACGTPVVAFKDNKKTSAKGTFGFLLSTSPEKAAEELMQIFEDHGILDEAANEGCKFVRNHCSLASLSRKMRTALEVIFKK